MWESDAFECSVEEPSSKKRETLDTKVRQSVAANAPVYTEENDMLDDNVAARQHLHNGLLLQVYHLATIALLMI